MAFPVIPILIACALYILQDDESDSSPNVNRKSPSSRKNKSVKITESAIDDVANTVPDSAPSPTEISVPTTETPPESENVQ